MERAQQQELLVQARQIDDICDRFEAQWHAGAAPRLEEALTSIAAEQRTDLLRALLAVELELCAAAGAAPDKPTYLQRFPDEHVLVEAAFAALAPQAATDTAVAAASDTSLSGPGQPTATQAYAGAQAEPLPRRIGRFEIQQLLGQGAFGKVYRARDPQLDRDVALKVPQLSALGSQRDLERLLREAKAAANIQHPNICPIHEVGQDGDTHYIVMAYVPGQSLAELLAARKAPMALRQAALIARKLALALDAAHAKGVVHRDLKPGNILHDRERKDLVIADFGLARRLCQDEAQLTQSGVITGTPAYMAPEQARGDSRRIGPAVDIYSLGVILYELLTSRRPFSGSVAEVIGQVLHVEPEPPSKHRPDVDPVLEAICLKALAKQPEERYPSMKALAEALGDYLKKHASGEPLPAATATSDTAPVEGPAREQCEKTGVTAAPQGRRRRLRTILAGAALSAALVLTGIFFFIRTGTTTIIIQVPLPDGLDLRDTTLAFFLNTKVVPAADLEKPCPLAPGDHELVIRRGDMVLNVVRFSVTTDRSQPIPQDRITIQSPAKPAPPVPDPKTPVAQPVDPERRVAEWVLQSRGLLDVLVDRQPRRIDSVAELPPGRFQVFGIYLNGNRDPGLDAGLQQLRGLEQLESLQLAATQVSDRSLESLRGLTSLRSLWLQETSVTGAGLVHLKDLVKLQDLQLGGTGASDAGLEHLKDLTELTSLALDGTRITDAGLAHVKNLWRLEALHVSSTTVTDRGLEALRGLTRLRSLRLHNTRVNGPGLVNLQPLTHLAELSLENTGVTDAALENLKGLTQLESLSLDGTRIADAGLVHLQGLTKLEGLHIASNAVGDRSLESLRGLKKLRVLWLQHSRVTGAGLVHLKDLTSMEELNLESTAVDDAGLAHLQGMTKLISIDLSGSKISDAGLVHVKGWRKLRGLHVAHTAVTDLGLEALRGLTCVHNLWLQGTRVTGPGLVHIKGMTKMNELFLQETPLTDAGLMHLYGFDQLPALDLRGTMVTDAGIEALKKALPRCRIIK